jgi:hypothetical protein
MRPEAGGTPRRVFTPLRGFVTSAQELSESIPVSRLMDGQPGRLIIWEEAFPIPMRTRPGRSLAALLVLSSSPCGQLPLAKGQTPTAVKTEAFDRDPGWEGVNNRVKVEKPIQVIQDFGTVPPTTREARPRAKSAAASSARRLRRFTGCASSSQRPSIANCTARAHSPSRTAAAFPR